MSKVRNWLAIAMMAFSFGCSGGAELTEEEEAQAKDTSTLTEEEQAAERAIK